VLFSEPKIPQYLSYEYMVVVFDVSVLFSEPKIPQFLLPTNPYPADDRFSALQRAENSSIDTRIDAFTGSSSVSVLFSEPKIPQLHYPKRTVVLVELRFSALQRAENSSIWSNERSFCRNWMFQCSSASRKFLNVGVLDDVAQICVVSVLFSEPKIPQL